MSENTRRVFLAAYVAPAILTLAAVPAFASHGSSKCHEDEDCLKRHPYLREPASRDDRSQP